MKTTVEKHNILSKLMAAVLLFSIFTVNPIHADYYDEEEDDELPEKCTAVYVGKDVSAEGTRIIARSEDQHFSAYNKMFLVEPRKSEEGRVMVDTGDRQNDFSVPIPTDTYKYTYLLNGTGLPDGPCYASCMNEYGLAAVGTVTTYVSAEYKKIDPLKKDGEGIREAILPALIACQAKNCEEAVEILGTYLAEYGSSEYNTMLFSDPTSAWIFEIYGGYSWAAMKLPDDQMSVFGNQVMLEYIDFNDTEHWRYSDNLEACLKKIAKPVKNKEGQYHLAKCIDPGARDPKCNMRTWRGHQLFAPKSAGTYSNGTFYPLLFKPEKKVSVVDVMTMFADRYEGTKYDMAKKANESLRSIGVSNQANVHIVQTFDELPAETCQLQWLAMADAEHAIFVPAFSGISDTYKKYKIDNEKEGMINDSYYYLCRKISSLAETDRTYLSQGVKDYNLKEEKKMLQRILKELPLIQEAYQSFDLVGESYVTMLGKEMAEEQYRNAENLYEHLAFTQMYNLNDRNTGTKGKVHFEMPEEQERVKNPIDDAKDF